MMMYFSRKEQLIPFYDLQLIFAAQYHISQQTCERLFRPQIVLPLTRQPYLIHKYILSLPRQLYRNKALCFVLTAHLHLLSGMSLTGERQKTQQFKETQLSPIAENLEKQSMKDEQFDLQSLTLQGIQQAKQQEDQSDTFIDNLEDFSPIQGYNETQISLEALREKIKGIDEHQYSLTPQNPLLKHAEPSQQEIKQCLMHIETTFPKGQLHSIIEDLHRILHSECPFSKYKMNRNRISIAPGESRFSGKQNDEVKIAISFLNYGYGLKILREQINDPNINATKYNNTITAIMKVAFRKLEELMKCFGRPVEPISYQEEKILRAPLINCDKWLPEDELQTYYKLIKAAYHLEKISISPQSLEKLYSSIMRQLKQRSAEEEATREDKRRKTIKIQDELKFNVPTRKQIQGDFHELIDDPHPNIVNILRSKIIQESQQKVGKVGKPGDQQQVEEGEALDEEDGESLQFLDEDQLKVSMLEDEEEMQQNTIGMTDIDMQIQESEEGDCHIIEKLQSEEEPRPNGPASNITSSKMLESINKIIKSKTSETTTKPVEELGEEEVDADEIGQLILSDEEATEEQLRGGLKNQQELVKIITKAKQQVTQMNRDAIAFKDAVQSIIQQLETPGQDTLKRKKSSKSNKAHTNAPPPNRALRSGAKPQVDNKAGKSSNYPNKPNTQRFQLEKEIAEVYVSRGYGLSLTKQYIKTEIEGNKYNSVLTSIIRAALRKLCDILSKNLKQNIPQFQGGEERLLRSPLVNCRKWLTKPEQLTFFKLIKIVYSLNPESIYQEEVFALYDKIMKQLHKRNEALCEKAPNKKLPIISSIKTVSGQSRTDSIENSETEKSEDVDEVPDPVIKGSPVFSKPATKAENKIPEYLVPKRNLPPANFFRPQTPVGSATPQNSQMVKYEKEIVQLYAKFRNMNSVFLVLSKKYKQASWKQEDLQQTVAKLIKIGLKKILKFRKQLSNGRSVLPPLNLNEHLVAQLISSPLAQETRVAVVKSLLEPNLPFQRVQSLINAVNSSLAVINNQQR